MPLIDRDATVSMLGENFKQGFWNGKCCAEYDVAEETIMDAPAVDAVPVVRCRECSNYIEYDDWDRNRAESFKCHECNILHRDFGAEGFCSYGERKEHD